MSTKISPRFIAATAAAAISLLTFSGCSKPEETAPIIRPVRTMLITEPTNLPGRVFPGRAEAVLAVDIAFEVPGQLIERLILVGDEVKKGQILAKLDPREYTNAVEASKARLERSVAYLSRIKEAAESGAVAKQDLTDAQAQHDIAAADLKTKEKALADTAIIAPFDGSIAAIYVENHQNVQSKESVVRMMDLSEIELKVDIPEKLISLATKAKEITVTFDAFPNEEVAATIKEIGREASSSTRTFPVTLAISQPEHFQILPGMTGQARGNNRTATLETGISQIPIEAIFEEAGKSYIWLVSAEPATVSRQEITKKESNSHGALVLGLEPGQVIIIAGTHNLSEGQAVRITTKQ